MNRFVVTFAATTAAITLTVAARIPASAADTDGTPSQVQTMSLVAAASQKATASARLTPAAAAAMKPTLAVGASNPAVIYVQRKLGVNPASGYFGRITESAVKTFQKKQHLATTGRVDSRTWVALLAAKPSSAKASTARAAKMKGTASAGKAAAAKATKKAMAAEKAARRAQAAKKAAAKAEAAAKKAASKRAAADAAKKAAYARKVAAAKEAAAAKKAAAAKEAAAKAAADKAAADKASALTPEQAAAQRPEIEFGDGPDDPAVIFVQRFLHVTPQTGYFGAMTREAVLAYQRGLGITASGIVGPRTWQAIFDGKTVDTAAAAADAEDPEAPTLSADPPPPAPVTPPTTGTIPTPTHTLPANATAADKALVFALAQVGKPYVLGGNGPDVFDCSGLVQQAYLSAGVQLPRLASQQQFAGTEVSLESLVPGDLLYYQDGSSPRRGHISMYAGNGLAVEAANPRRGVRIRPLNESWYAERFVRATHISG